MNNNNNNKFNANSNCYDPNVLHKLNIKLTMCL